MHWQNRSKPFPLLKEHPVSAGGDVPTLPQPHSGPVPAHPGGAPGMVTILGRRCSVKLINSPLLLGNSSNSPHIQQSPSCLCLEVMQPDFLVPAGDSARRHPTHPQPSEAGHIPASTGPARGFCSPGCITATSWGTSHLPLPYPGDTWGCVLINS